MPFERDRGTFDGLVLSPVDSGTLFLGKFGAALLSILAVEAIALPVFAALYDLPALDPAAIGIVVAGSIGLACLGTLFSAVTSATRSREVLLPLLLFPMMIPVLIAAVRATSEVFHGDTGAIARWINLLIGFDVIFLVLSFLGFSSLIED